MSAGVRRRSGWLSAAALLASVAVHLCLIAFLAWSIRSTSVSPDGAPVEVSLWSLGPTSKPTAQRAGGRGPSPASPRAATPTPPGVTTPPSLPLPSGDAVHATDAVRGLLRGSVGCDHAAAFHLTPDELDQCRRRAQRLGEDAPTFAARPHDDRKLAAFDQAARENAAERRAREGPMAQPIPLCGGPGSNFGRGCLSPHYEKGAQGTSEADQRSVWH